MELSPSSPFSPITEGKQQSPITEHDNHNHTNNKLTKLQVIVNVIKADNMFDIIILYLSSLHSELTMFNPR